MNNIRNIAAIAEATQSSYSKWSLNDHESVNVLKGFCENGYGFHTSYEFEPWWSCDLKREYPIHSIKVYYRKEYSINWSDIKLRVSCNLLDWEEIVVKTEEEGVCVFNLDFKSVRFVHIQSMIEGFLYLRQVEIMYNDDMYSFRGIALMRDNSVSDTVWDRILSGGYERTEINIALKTVQEDDVCLELGSSLGAVSTMVCKNRKPVAYYCVEANLDMVNLMKKNHSINHVFCEVLHGAVTNGVEKTANFYIHKDSFASSLTKFENPIRIDKINMFNFNELLLKTKASYLICDIEGGEYSLFDESLDLKYVKKVCIEFHQGTQSINTKNIFKLFKDNGFVCDKEYSFDKQGVAYFYKS